MASKRTISQMSALTVQQFFSDSEVRFEVCRGLGNCQASGSEITADILESLISGDGTVTANVVDGKLVLNGGITQDLILGTRTGSTLDIGIELGMGVTLPSATTALSGLMSAADKTKLDGVTPAIVNDGVLTIMTSGVLTGSTTFTANQAESNNFTIAAPAFGTTSGTIAQGNDSRFHVPITLGTTNGLSLSGQQIALQAATDSTTGALTSSDWTTFNDKQSPLMGTGVVLSSSGTITYKTGIAGQILRKNLANTDYEFFTPSYITPSYFSAIAPLSYNSGTGVFSIPKSNASTDGYIAATDFAVFSNKQGALSGTGIVNSSSGVISYQSGTSGQVLRRNLTNTDYEFYTPSTPSWQDTLSVNNTSTLGFSLISGANTTSINANGILKSGGTPLLIAAISGSYIRVASNNTTYGSILDNSDLTADRYFSFPNSSGRAIITINNIAPDVNGNLNIPTGVGTVTNVTGTSPIDVINNASTPVISIPKATSSVNGYLGSSDWANFNSKAPGTGGTGYIQNQNSVYQSSSNFKISGTGEVGSDFIASGKVIAGNNKGFRNATYSEHAPNPIWSFDTEPNYGMAYYQGNSISPQVGDAIGFHFGNINTPKAFINNAGQLRITAFCVSTALQGNASPGTFYVEGDGQLDGNLALGGSPTAEKLIVYGSIRQTAVSSSLLKSDSNGKIVAAVIGTDFGLPAENNLNYSSSQSPSIAQLFPNGEVTCNIYVDATAATTTITLPAASTWTSKTINMIKTDASANTVTVKGNGSELINATNTYMLSIQFANGAFKANGGRVWIFG